MTPHTLGSGGLGISAVVDDSAGQAARRSLAEEVPLRIERSHLRVNLHVPASDRDTRAVISGGLLAAIALAWTGLLALRGVVRSARDGDPFVRRNVARLRRLGVALLAAPALVALANRMLEDTFEGGPVRAYFAHVDAYPFVVAALGAFALAEVFREGTTLRELEQSTV